MDHLHITDRQTLTTVQKLAELTKKSSTEAIREAVEHEYERACAKNDFLRGIKEIQEEFARISKPGGLPADKAFYDELSSEDELTGLP
jgi:antitoxin VapB